MTRALPLLCAALLLAAAQATAAEPAGIEVDQAWARATGGMTQSGAAYLTLVNRGPSDDRLVAVSTPEAKMADLHEMSMDSRNVMHMRRLDNGLALPAGKTVRLAPGGYHVMLMRLKSPLKAGETFPLTLRFAKAGERTIEVTVMPIGAAGPATGQTGHMGGMPGKGGMQGGGAMPMSHPQER